MDKNTGEVYTDEPVTAKEKEPDVPWWRTIGFTLKNNYIADCDPSGKPKGVFDIKESHKNEWNDNGIVYTKFKFPYSLIDEKMEDAKVTAATLKETNQHVYLNGRFQVYYGGGTKKKGGVKDTLNEIVDAEEWSSTSGFKERFNMPLKIPKDIEVDKHPVYLTTMRYSNTNGYVTDSTKLIGYYTKRTYYSITTSSIDASYNSPISGNQLWLFQTHWSKLKDSKTVHSNGTYRTMKEKLKSSINPLTDWEDYKLSLQALRNRQFEIVDGGIEIVCVYKNQTIAPPPDPEDPPDGISGTNDYSRDIVTPKTSCIINSNTRENEIFNSEEAIPTSEYQYVNVMTSEYLAQYTYRQYYGVKYYQQKTTSTTSINVPRSYSYWKIVDLNVYAISSSYIENESLPAGSVTLNPTSGCYTAPYISYNVYSSNMIEPSSGGTSVGEIKVRNDALYFNGTLLMSGEWCSTNTKAPEVLPVASSINQNALYRTGLLIDPLKQNKECDTQATVKYVRICHYGDDAEGNVIELDVENVNNVTIHTPTICDTTVQDTKTYNQMISPDESMAGIVLDTYFKVHFPTEGTHDINLKGYQTRDYAKYIKRREVKFPFDVYKDGNYIKSGTWIEVTEEYPAFYLPTWVEDDTTYTIEFRSRTINCDTNNGLDQTEDLANLDYNNYVATDTVDVQVSGRLYNFNVYDISDYPTWQKVFRETDSLKLTNFDYAAGTKDRNGNQSYTYSGLARDIRFTLPIVEGSHPVYDNIGPVKTGYYNRFSVSTMGQFDTNDYITITPRFFFVDYIGKNRQEVDLYYTEYFETDKKKHIMVKVGSDLDKKNTHRIDRNDPYLGVRGGTAISSETRGSWTFGDIKITGATMLLSGNHSRFVPQQTTTDSTLLAKQKRAVQTWFCEYYLPSKLYVCPKGYNVDRYALDHNGLDFKENFWLKQGYVIIHFDIEVVKDGQRYLSYTNKENALKGYCNMWSMEEIQLTKTDYRGNVFNFKYGDYIMYYAAPNMSVRNDYRSGGIY